ncbi:MAG: hypothetical protein A2V85_06335 [Chloroflexi bacterium RBG_16_72_14]|nr:MAG: hypothetical protein A2V85_06335 [Chloroflexi bacterium RBG_16_72_14]
MPKVVLVVGPVGSLTASYRSQADKAAAAAAAAGAQVVKVYSPDATWPAVQRAAEGASIVVYLGHGNGWPSRYRDALYPPTQNGFGLNPVAGVDDSTHQYFGEAFIDDLDLAPNAVVVLSHLCYASGNTEPGLSEGTADLAVQRVDNYAAGFLRAGARAVVAEGHMGPAYYVKSLLTTGLTIEQIWNRSPTAKGHAFGVASVRSPGFTARLDPDKATGGYFRSLVSAGVSASAMRAGATGNAGTPYAGPPAQPSLASLGLRFGTPSLQALPIAGTGTHLTLALAKAGLKTVPKGAQVGVRWDPILLDPEPAPSPAASPSPAPSAAPSPTPTPSASPEPSPSGSPEPSPTPDSEASVPEVELVVPEQVGSVVTLATVRSTANGLVLDVRYPGAPGLYRLVPTLHTPSGVAYDAATQALLTPMIVRVAGPVAVAYGAPTSLAVTASSAAPLAVRVVNAGSEAWDAVATSPTELAGEALLTWLRTSRVPAQLVATWVSAQGLPVPAPVSAVLDLEASVPGSGLVVQLDLTAPPAAGEYLLLLDIVSPAHGSLSALGSAPALVRVSVSPAPAASPEPAPATPDTRD